MSATILAVFTLYHPESDRIQSLVKNCLAYSGCDVFLSDNAGISDELKSHFNSPRITYHSNGGNLGLGGALNKGLTLALEKNYDYAVLFDQDSQMESDFIEKMIHEFELVRDKDPKIIAAGPFFNDAMPTENVYRKMIITSGTIIKLPLLKTVGLIDEVLFIDYVDTEWCYRARAKGYSIMKLAKVKMIRQIGHTKKLWFGLTLNYHHYSRTYYFFRNAIIMVKKKHLPSRRLLKLSRHIFNLPFLDNRWKRLTLMCKGIRDGLRFS